MTGNITNNTGVFESFMKSQAQTFRIHEYFYFINFQFYVMKGESAEGFILLYSILSGSFLLFLFILFMVSGRVFEA